MHAPVPVQAPVSLPVCNQVAESSRNEQTRLTHWNGEFIQGSCLIPESNKDHSARTSFFYNILQLGFISLYLVFFVFF